MSTHYQTLGVDPDASLDEIKAAHRRLVKLWHPDANLDDRNDEEAENARQASAEARRERFEAIEKAYQALKDPQQRSDYDISLSRKILEGQPQASEQALTGKNETERPALSPAMDSQPQKGSPLPAFAFVGAAMALSSWLGDVVDQANAAKEAAQAVLQNNLEALGNGGQALADKAKTLDPEYAEKWLNHSGIETSGLNPEQMMNLAKEKMTTIANQTSEAHTQVLETLNEGGMNLSEKEYFELLKDKNPQEMIASLDTLQPDAWGQAMEHISGAMEALNNTGALQAVAFASTAFAAVKLGKSAIEAFQEKDAGKFFNLDNAGNVLRVAEAATPVAVIGIHAAQTIISLSTEERLNHSTQRREENTAYVQTLTQQIQEGQGSWKDKAQVAAAITNGGLIAAINESAKAMNGARQFLQNLFKGNDKTPSIESDGTAAPSLEGQPNTAQALEPSTEPVKSLPEGKTSENRIPETMRQLAEKLDGYKLNRSGDASDPLVIDGYFKARMDLIEKNGGNDDGINAAVLSLEIDSMKKLSLTPEQQQDLDTLNQYLKISSSEIYGQGSLESKKLYMVSYELDQLLSKNGSDNNDKVFELIYAMQEGTFDFNDPRAVQGAANLLGAVKGEIENRLDNVNDNNIDKDINRKYETMAEQVTTYIKESFAKNGNQKDLDEAMSNADMYADFNAAVNQYQQVAMMTGGAFR